MLEMENQLSLFDQDFSFGKMSPEPSAPTKDKTSELSLNPSPKLSKKMPLYLCLRKTNGQQAVASWEMGGALLGEFKMHSFGESPKEDVESHLSQILEENVPQKYYLSKTACEGILRRAERRGKELPPMLKEALLYMIEMERHTESVVGTRAGFCNGVITCYDIGDRRRNPNEFVDVTPALLNKMGTGGNNVPVVVEGMDAYNQSLTGDKANCLRSKNADTDHIPCVVMDRSAYNQGENAKFNIGIDENGVAFSHIAKGPGAVCCLETFHCIAQEDGTCFTLKARDYKDMHVICLQGNQIDQADTSVCNGSGFKEGTSYTLNVRDRHAVAYKKPHYVVRRLTPLECERLQGFPDGWTDIGEYTDSKGKKKKSSDSARYKALGNSIALPPWKYVIKRLCSHYERDATMASLFDGIGGFPRLWEQINGKGTAVWASEIEDFPMAVTKVRIE